jgi:hypothetical protein
MKRCIATHEKCRLTLATGATSFVPTRLLDVDNNVVRLVESANDIEQGADRRFLALSHCWGSIPIIRTLRDNYQDHREVIAPERLSKTFRDAVHTTRKLGYRYLWVDSLCIIQDDRDDWMREAATMCDVYQYATLTIAAAHAATGNVGCFAERDGLLQIPFYIEIAQSRAVTSIRIQFASYGRIANVAGGDPALYGRAWVLQEQLLSPRMLMFDGLQLRWECLTTHGTEMSPLSGSTRQGLHHQYIRSGIMDDIEFFDRPDTYAHLLQDDFSWARMKHQYWCDLVMEYTHRGMTKTTDRLVAVAGIAKALNRHTTSEYLAGLWSLEFTSGLLWSIAHNEKWMLSADKGFDIYSNKKVRHDEPLAPTWSWASVTVPIMYAQTELLSYDRICELIDVNVAGTVDKQTGEAKIRGHVRRGYVNAVYPQSIQEAATHFSHMMVPEPAGRFQNVTFKGRLFQPHDYFLFSGTHPATRNKASSAYATSTSGSFRFLRGSFRPDELIDPSTEVTFLAIAQQHFGNQLTSLLHTHHDQAALKVHTLALVPTNKRLGEYRRVGLAIWDQCAWYGYLCGRKDERDRKIYRPSNFTSEGFRKSDTWWDWVARKLWWDDVECFEECREGAHDHGYEKDCLPEMEKYHKNTKVEMKALIII